MMRALITSGLSLAGLLLCPTDVSAHTDADLVAVAAGEDAEVTLKPTHGCGGSPTVQVAVRAPVEGATGGEVAGWQVTAEADGEGHTVLRWTGGSLPADETGEFPVIFSAPATVGALLTFPSVQYCADGSELAWISGDPASEFPAPRLLVLPVGSEPAESLDDVALDAPGRDQLVEVVDVDNPLVTTTTIAIATSPPPTTSAPPSTQPPVATTAGSAQPLPTDAPSASTSAPTSASTSAPTSATTAGAPEPPPTTSTTDSPDGGSNATVIVIVIVIVIVVAGTAVVVGKRRHR